MLAYMHTCMLANTHTYMQTDRQTDRQTRTYVYVMCIIYIYTYTDIPDCTRQVQSGMSFIYIQKFLSSIHQSFSRGQPSGRHQHTPQGKWCSWCFNDRKKQNISFPANKSLRFGICGSSGTFFRWGFLFDSKKYSIMYNHIQTSFQQEYVLVVVYFLPIISSKSESSLFGKWLVWVWHILSFFSLVSSNALEQDNLFQKPIEYTNLVKHTRVKSLVDGQLVEL